MFNIFVNQVVDAVRHIFQHATLTLFILGLTIQQRWGTYLGPWLKSSEAADWGEQDDKKNHRWRILGLCLGEAMQRGEEPTRDNWSRIVSTATARVIDYEVAAMAASGQVTAQAEAAKPENSLPHEDIPELRGIRTVADVVRVSKNLDLLKRFKNLRPGSKDYAEFNERVACIKQHNIRTSTLPAGQPPAKTRNEQLNPAEALIESLSPRDFHNSSSSIDVNVRTGEVTGGGSKFQKAEKAKSELRQLAASLRRQGLDELKIRDQVQNRIDQLTSSSIR